MGAEVFVLHDIVYLGPLGFLLPSALLTETCNFFLDAIPFFLHSGELKMHGDFLFQAL
eukprot:m.29037 g.29037  ORF g.29037 m.29037 type:complete len:58 (+) comp4620_c0_seq2:76-249(+)